MSANYVLVAEADLARSGLYANLLGSLGLTVETVRDGGKALQTVQQKGPPALLLTELSLPGLDGFQLIQRLHQTAATKQVPVIAVSAFRALRDAAVQRRQELGIATVLACSSPMSTLQRAIQAALARKPSQVAAESPERTEELSRLEQIESMKLVEEGPQDPVLEEIVRTTAREFNAPIALVSLVLRDRQWFKAHVGLSGALLADRGTPREWAFCQHVVASREPLLVPDAAHHPVFATNPLVRDGTVRSYAGAPLVTASGEVLGTLCILDTQRHELGPEELEKLKLWARRVVGELELRALQTQPTGLSQALLERLRPVTPTPEASVGVLRAVLDQLDAGVLLMDADRRILYANAELGRMFAVDPRRLVGQLREAWLDAGACLAANPELFRATLKVPSQGAYAGRAELELSRPTRRVVRWTAKPVPLGNGIGQLALLSDVTAEHDAAAQRERLILTDFLTGLANRRGGEEALAREVSRSQRTSEPLSVAFIDVDKFKEINDSLGHEVGDAVLQGVAERIRGRLRGSDLPVRWGGDEFLAVLPGANREAALKVGEAIRASIAGLRFEGHGVTVSIGVGEWKKGDGLQELIARADAALYGVKRGGRDGVGG